MDLPSFHCH